MDVLNECGFPGNIRELESCIYQGRLHLSKPRAARALARERVAPFKPG